MTVPRAMILALLLVSATAQTPAHVSLPGSGLTVTVAEHSSLTSADVYLTLAVFGSGASHIEHGMLMPRTRGYLHVDWIGKPSDWSKVLAGPSNPNDASPAQIQATVATVERLGFPASAIRSSRRPIPAFQTGGGSVEIGEILVDLGSAQQAPKALARFSSVSDPFSRIPANVTYGRLFAYPDCAQLTKTMNDLAVSATGKTASIVSSVVGQHVAFAELTATAITPVLCTQDDEPELPYTQYSVPDFDADILSYTQVDTVHYTLGARSRVPASVPPLRGLPIQNESGGHDFVLPAGTPYAATLGSSSVCDLATAIVRSRANARAAADVLHERLGPLLAITIPANTNQTCAYGTIVDAAWELLTHSTTHGAPATAAREYVGTAASGVTASGTERLHLRALVNAVRLAKVDGARIWSLYERECLMDSDQTNAPETTDAITVWSRR